MKLQLSPYRKIVKKTWRKPRFRKLEPLLQRVLMYLWTGPENDHPGLYYITYSTVADDLATDVETVKEWFAKLIKDDWFEYDEEARLIFFPKWWEYDPPANGNVVIGAYRYAADCPTSPLKFRFCTDLVTYAQRFNITLDQCFPEGLPDDFRNRSLKGIGIQDIEQDKEQDTPKSEAEASEVAAGELTQLLATLMLVNKPDRKQPNVSGATWKKRTMEAIEKLIRIDGRDPERVKKVLVWSQNDNEPRGPGGFCWATNILSGEKLRKHFDRMEMQMQHEEATPAQSTSDRGF